MASQDASQSLLACWPSCGLWGSRYALPRSVCRENCKLNKANELQAFREGVGGGRKQEESRKRGEKRLEEVQEKESREEGRDFRQKCRKKATKIA